MPLPANAACALVFNPKAGRRALDIDAVKDLLAARTDLRTYQTSVSRGPTACARQALAEGARVIVAAGGDGTVSSVAAALIGSDVPLGIIPCGTANSVAGALGVPTRAPDAVATILDGERRTIDTATANGVPMLLHASVGLHAATIADTPAAAKQRWGVLAYAVTAIESLRTLEPFQVELETESEIIRCRASNVTVANLAPMRTIVAQGPSAILPDDGTLDVTIFAATTLAEAVATGVHLLRTAAFGAPATRDNVGYFSARRLRVSATPGQPLLIDGEDAGTGDLRLACVPRSLSVLVPFQEATARPAEDKLAGLPELEIEHKPAT